MSKPIVFQLEFSGLQEVRIDDGVFIRPPTAQEIATAIAEDIQDRVNRASPGRKFKVKVKRVA